MIKIRLAQISDVSHLKDHLIRHGSESGNQGDLIFAPYEEPWSQSEDSLRTDKAEKWNKPLTDTGWERCWIVIDENGIYGELKLAQKPPLRTALHRTTLMMGIERSHRHQGLGTKLINEAISWAREQSTLEWIDLYVFAHNKPALMLYSMLGFREVGRVEDLFRVHGQKIDDIHMVLKLRE